MVFKREDWNNLIDDVNSVLQNPPSGCDPLPPLDHVGPNHRWSKADIEQVHEAIMATCDEIAFDAIPDLWKQSTIDEIYSKLAEAWCDCECDLENKDSWTYFDELVLYRWEATGCTNCPWGPDCEGDFVICDELHGMEVGPPGVIGRQWSLMRRLSGATAPGYTNGTSVIVRGTVGCDGKIICPSGTATSNSKYGKGWGFSQFATDCDSFAEASYNESMQTVDQFGTLELFILVSLSPSAECQDCS